MISELRKSKTIYEFNILEKIDGNILGESKIEMDNPDPLFEQQEALFKMKFPEAWDLTTGNKNVIIAIFDTGIDWYHPDMKDNIFINNAEMQNANIDWVNGQIYGDGIDNDGNGYIDDVIGWDFKNNDNNPFIEDYYIGKDHVGVHGSLVSSVCGALGNNGQFISGTNWNVSILCMKVDRYWVSNSIEAIDYCVGMGVNVINMSYGASSWSSQTQFHQAIQDAYNNHNILFVSIAQNYNNETKVYPGAWPEVMALAATMLDDTKKSDSNYGDWVECTATVEKNGFLNYNFSTHNHIGYVSTGATSTAAPLTSGLAGLLMALNPYLSNVQVRNIINETCDNIDAANPAYIGKLGSDRINAYQAVLLGAAYANKSQYAGALSLNNTRHLDRAGGKLHLIFHSGGEVFYRRSADNGNSWELTKRLTTGNGSNARESLVAAHDNSVHVVFQHKNDDGTYNVMYTYSSDNGSSWSDPVALVSNISVSSYQSKGPQPVITEGYINNTYTLMVVYTSSSGLYYMTKATASGSWSSPINLPTQQAEWYNSRVWFPGLAAYGNKIILTYDYRYYGVYSRIFDGNWSNENKVSDVTGTIYDRYTCIANYSSSGHIAAWSAQKSGDSRWRVVFRRGNTDNSWSDWFEVWEPPANISHLQPVITWYDNNDPAESNAIAIIYYDSDKNVYVRKWAQSGNEWTVSILDGQSQYPSVTMVKSINDAPLYSWSNGAQTPYLLKLQEQSLNKTSAIVKTALYKRAGVVYDASTQTKHCVEVGDYLLTTEDGSKFRIGFQEYDQEKDLDLNTENMWQYLESEPFTIPQDGLELSYTQELSTITIGDSIKSQNAVALAVDQFELLLEDVNQGKTVAVLSGDVESKSGKVDVSAYAGRTVIIKPVVKMNFSDSKALSYGLGNIYRDEKQDEALVKSLTTSQMLPEEAILISNYPNPFNPSTTIRFALPKDGKVQLNIYSVNGQKVRTLLDGQVSKGYHQIVWDGKNESGQAVSGGLYVYELRTENKRLLKKMLLVK